MFILTDEPLRRALVDWHHQTSFFLITGTMFATKIYALWKSREYVTASHVVHMLRMGLSLWKNWIVRKNVNYGLREHLIKIADVAGGAIRQTTFEDQPRVAGITTNKMNARRREQTFAGTHDSNNHNKWQRPDKTSKHTHTHTHTQRSRPSDNNH